MKIKATLIFLIIIIESGYSQIGSQPLRIMFYNVENFFDTSDDSLKDDNEFLPNGLMRWNIKRYNKKLNSLYKTIISSGTWNPPDIVAFCEIEHKQILEDLLFKTYLSKFNYEIIHEESPDRRGIDVCLIFRKKSARLLYYKYLMPRNVSFTSRSVLYAKFLVGGDSIHIFINHWPSRRGGVLAGEANRQDIASDVRAKIDSIIGTSVKSKIVILGDFNCSPEDKIIKDFLQANDSVNSLINLADSLNSMGNGTYRYAGSWEMIDQVLISKSLVNSQDGLFTKRSLFKIIKPGFLLQKDPKYPGSSPFPTYHGYKYAGGYSDHLPIVLELNVRK